MEIALNGQLFFEEIGVRFPMEGQFISGKTTVADHDSTWKPFTGNFNTIRDRHREYTTVFQNQQYGLKLIARLYDNAVSFRWEISCIGGAPPADLNYYCHFRPAIDYMIWHANGEWDPVGPITFEEFAVREKVGADFPLLFDAGENGIAAIMESDLLTGNETAGFKTMHLLANIQNKSVTAAFKGRMKRRRVLTPWRVVLIERESKDLFTNHAALNVAPKCKLKDTSWIKPGAKVWEWRYRHSQYFDHMYKFDTAALKHLVDFSAENRFPYLLVDGGWYEDCSPAGIVPRSGLDIREVIRYAKQRNVGVFLYYDEHYARISGKKKTRDPEKLVPFETVFSWFAQLGAAGVKYGFMDDDPDFTRKSAEAAARHKLMISYHDYPTPMVGIERTLPNAMIREYCHAQGDRRSTFSPNGFLKQMVINSLCGPMDQGNGVYSLNKVMDRNYAPLDPWYSTVISENARIMMLWTGLPLLPDPPLAYQKKADLFEFIQAMPTSASWDETAVINSKIGTLLTMVRRSGNTWFVGTVVDEKGAYFEIDFSFLPEGKIYDATFYEDDLYTHYRERMEDYRIRHGQIKHGDKRTFRAACGGGHCILLRSGK